MIQFIALRNLWFFISGALFIASVALIAIFGLRFGIDFTGGSLMEVEFATPVESPAIVQAVADAEKEAQATVGSAPASPVTIMTQTDEEQVAAPEALPEESGVVELGVPLIQSAGENTVVIRTKFMDNQTHDIVLTHLQKLNGDQPVEEHRFETIGPTIGATLKKHALISITLASFLIVLYIAFAFRKLPSHLSSWKFGLTAVIALLHDTVITIGVFALLGKVIGIEIDSLFVTALLTVMGFSVHDTIVVFDRIRENAVHHRDENFSIVANEALNQTMARSINTSLTTLITLTALFVLGGESIRWFVLALIVGIVVGTYSSIFVATPLVVVWRKKEGGL